MNITSGKAEIIWPTIESEINHSFLFSRWLPYNYFSNKQIFNFEMTNSTTY
jgi:hypothetical protein